MKTLLILLATIVNSFVFAQESHNNVIKIDQLQQLEQSIYEQLNSYKLIMIGEMHGTNEPVNFLQGLAELFTKNGDTVQVEFEIPSEKMQIFNQLKTAESVFQSDFFTEDSNDGRASVAWAKVIASLSNNPKIKIFFYDINASENVENRDSIMYLKIREQLTRYPNRRTITISGNIHNMLTMFRKKPTAAYYLVNDKELNLSDKIFSISHHYLKGTMLNNVGNGLELREVENDSSYFSETFEFDNYLYFFPQANSYHGLLYTKIVTAAKLTSNK